MPRKCAPRSGKLTTKERKRLASSTFGLPEKRSYPMPDVSHARNAKARASTQYKRGNLTRAEYQKIQRKANRIIRDCGGEPARVKKKSSKKNPRGSSRAPLPLKDATFADLDAKVIEVEAGDELHKWRPGPTMLWSPESQALVMMEGVKLGRSTRNPDARSEDARGRFSGRESDKVRSGRIPDFKWQKMGPVRALTYRFNGNKTAWEHPFSRPPTLHRGDGPGGVRMWVVRGGGLRLTRRGIMG